MNFPFRRLLLSAAFCFACAQAQPTHDKTRVLIVDGFSNHDWKQTTRWTRSILESSDLFTVEVSTAPPKRNSEGWESWLPAFSNYDVVVQNCNSLGGRPSWPLEVRDDLEAFVRNGGGLYVLHSGNNSFESWEAYNKMIGLGWRNKDFGPAITIDDAGKTVRVPAGEGANTGHGPRFDAVVTRLGTHPIHEGLPRRWKSADLEVYRYARGPAENLTVLSYANEPATEVNFPIEWVVQYGKGRVYVSTYGHVWKNDPNPPAARCVAFQTLMVRAVEWLAGTEVSFPIPDDFPDEGGVRGRAAVDSTAKRPHRN